ncbi:hypothetical protein BAE44_0006498, partial [Dichanthelium oligosanthes]
LSTHGKRRYVENSDAYLKNLLED